MRNLKEILEPLRKDRFFLSVSGAMVLFGIVLRIQNLAYPKQLTFDEHHFVNNARNYLLAKPDWNDHPPLGKLLIALGMKLFGDNSFGWRIVPLCFGLATIAIAWGIGRSLFKSRNAGAAAAAVIAADGFFISYSRTALLDGMLVTLLLASALATIRARKPWHVALACTLVGFAFSIKFTGVVMAVPVVLLTLVAAQAPRWTVAFLALVPVVYWACFATGLSMIGVSSGPEAVLKATRALLSHHLALTEMVNPATSYWYTWFLPVHPIFLRFDQNPNYVRVMTTMGNPLLWWSATVLLAATAVSSVWKGAVWVRSRTGAGLPDPFGGFFRDQARPAALLLLLWLLPLLPWILTRRDSYIYHYLSCYGFGLLLVAGLIAWVYERRAVWGLAALLVVAEVSAFYGPVWGQQPLTRESMEQRLFLEKWR